MPPLNGARGSGTKNDFLYCATPHAHAWGYLKTPSRLDQPDDSSHGGCCGTASIPQDCGGCKTITDQDKIEKRMLPSEFMHIPDFRAIVKFSAYGVSEVEIPREFHEVRGEHFVDRHYGGFSKKVPKDFEATQSTLEKLKVLVDENDGTPK